MPSPYCTPIGSPEYIQQWEQFTLQQQKASLEALMQRAAKAFVGKWLLLHPSPTDCYIFCGPGNNGGDGFYIARLLKEKGYQPQVFHLTSNGVLPEHIRLCLEELQQKGVALQLLTTESDFPALPAHSWVIDALFGAGLNRALNPLCTLLVNHINQSEANVWSVDMPSGMGANQFIPGACIRATVTISFEVPKPAFFLSLNTENLGKWEIVSIGLAEDFPAQYPPVLQLLNADYILTIFKPRQAHQHKGNFGHALLVAGSAGKMGAAILATRACLQSGAGLVTAHIPHTYANALHADLPESMVTFRENGLPALSPYRSIGIGPGMGSDSAAEDCLHSILVNCSQPLVLDADAFTILSKHPEWLSTIPAGTILTPHPKEFDRMFGSQPDEYARATKALAISNQHPWVLVLKGSRTLICQQGKGWYNTTGNVGLAKGGSGDVLTGMITALLAQGYGSLEAAQLGVYLHGLSADIAVKTSAYESLLATDVISHIPAAFRTLYHTPADN